MSLKELSIKELEELMNQRYELFLQTNDGSDNVWRNQYIEISEEYHRRMEEKEIVIDVFYEEGYRWSVRVDGEEESRDSNITKAEAMRIARKVKKEFSNSRINEEKLNRKERSENMKYIHRNTLTFHGDEKYSYMG